MIEPYLAQRRVAGYMEYRSVKALRPVRKYLAPLGVLPIRREVPPDPVDEMLGPQPRLDARRARCDAWDAMRLSGRRAALRGDSGARQCARGPRVGPALQGPARRAHRLDSRLRMSGRSISVVAAARELTKLLFFGLRDGDIRRLSTPRTRATAPRGPGDGSYSVFAVQRRCPQQDSNLRHTV